MIFWAKSAQKRYLGTKPKKANIPIEFCVLELVYVRNFSLNWQFYWTISWTKFDQKGYFQSKNEKTNYTIEFCIFELTILILWTNLPKKGYSHSKTEKVNITTKFCIFKLISVPNLKLKLKIVIFWTKFTHKRVFMVKSEHYH